MRREFLRFALAMFLAAGVGAPLYAWNSYGHMTVAYIAYQNLKPEIRDKVNALLAKNPDFPNWEKLVPAGTSDDDKKLMIFMIAATWADRIKGNPDFKDEDPQHPNRPDGPSSFNNDGFSDHFRHRYWHFIDIPFAQDGTTQMPDIPTPNVKERIARFRKVLGSSDEDLKAYDISWLLHLVGDVHQPLHCVTRVGKNEPDGDDGGNKVSLTCPKSKPDCKAQLHGFWDDILGPRDAKLKSIIKSAKKLQAANAAKANDLDEEHWVAEGLQKAQDTVYVDPIKIGLGPFEKSSAYRKTAKALAKERVALAGARLADILNNELK